ncbi:hypothetical protein [Bradyrhizobium sp. 192]|uniref:hypothetical protein n=1 Tax=Bradyrhizobium sp. 192 TaxID=2782660 RepID=UPI0020001AF2|nr:hypothetical protein [Bradyrhizobium sp. 192]UPJ62064.1 hypothetical protein IVB24_38255 [Bradyrhizobium sp. 192]
MKYKRLSGLWIIVLAFVLAFRLAKIGAEAAVLAADSRKSAATQGVSSTVPEKPTTEDTPKN